MYDLVFAAAGCTKDLIPEARRVGQMIYNHNNSDPSPHTVMYGIGSSDENDDYHLLDGSPTLELPPGWYEAPSHHREERGTSMNRTKEGQFRQLT